MGRVSFVVWALSHDATEMVKILHRHEIVMRRPGMDYMSLHQIKIFSFHFGLGYVYSKS